MTKTKLQFGLALTLVVLGIVEAVTGFVLWLVLPSGGGAGRYGIEREFINISRQTWIDIHDWIAVALIVVTLIHLCIHWKWLFRMTRSLFAQVFSRDNDQFAPVFANIKNKGGN
jgi:hypothetical protein